MGSQSLKLPIIELSKVREEERESTKIRIQEALQEYGCFEATYDGIPPHLRQSLFDGIQQLFDLSLEIKQRNRSEKPYHGYDGQHAYAPLYESMGIDDALSPGAIDTFFTSLMWPQGHPTFSKSIELYCEQLSEVDKMVRNMVLESLGLEKYMEEHTNLTNYLARVIKYTGPQTRDTEVGLVPHTDKNMVTILHQLNQVGGLEFLTKDGKNWISAHPSSPNSFFVLIGTSFHAWTNGRLHLPCHRVMMTGDVARYTIGLFSNPKPGCTIKAPDEMVDEDHPLLFKPFDYFQFIDFVYSDAGRTSPNDIMEYCGA